jgi:phage-related protein
VFFSCSKVFLEELVVFEQLDHERELVGAWLGRLLVCLHCFQEHGQVREKESSRGSLQKKPREKEVNKD